MSGSVWRVQTYTDSVKLVKQRTSGPSIYFETEAEAAAFVIARAEDKVAAATSTLRAAHAQLARARRKFGRAAHDLRGRMTDHTEAEP